MSMIVRRLRLLYASFVLCSKTVKGNAFTGNDSAGTGAFSTHQHDDIRTVLGCAQNKENI
eukprot:6187814-Pleurochrysis_carterae.AAC.1